MRDESHADGPAEDASRRRHGGLFNVDDDIAEAVAIWKKLVSDIEEGRFKITITVEKKP